MLGFFVSNGYIAVTWDALLTGSAIFFWLLQTKCSGGNVKERVRQLWMDIDAAYKRDDDRLQNLTVTMI